jgi:hypothetical protein
MQTSLATLRFAGFYESSYDSELSYAMEAMLWSRNADKTSLMILALLPCTHI